MARRNGAVAFLFIALPLALGCAVSGGGTLEYQSPKRTYTIQFVGRKSAPTVPLLEYSFRARIVKGTTPIVDNWTIHLADWFDTSFEQEYEAPAWITENVLRLPSSGGEPRGNAPENVIAIENNSGHALRLLTVKAADLFLVLDVPSGWKGLFRSTHPAIWVEAGGVSADGTILRKVGVNFSLPKEVEGGFRYVIDVLPASVVIRATQGDIFIPGYR